MLVKVTNTTSRVCPETNQEAKAASAAAGRLAVMAPGAEYTWKYRHGEWDGKVYVAHKHQQHFVVPTGYLPTFLEAVGCPATLEDERGIVQPTLQQATVPLRDYQWDAAKSVLRNNYGGLWWPRGVVRLATGLGKTETAVGLIQMFDRPTLFVVHLKHLLDQAWERCRKYGLDAGRIGDGIFEPAIVTVATIQTLASLLDSPSDQRRLDFLKDVELAIVDEAHGIAAALDKGNQYTKVLNAMPNAYARVGLTATPFLRDRYSNMLLEGSTGRLLIERDARWGIDNGYLSDAEVKMLSVPALKEVLFRVPKGEKGTRYSRAYSEAVEHYDLRNRLILDELERLPGPTLVLVKTVTHGNVLARMAEERGLSLPFVHGENSAKERKQAVEEMVKSNGRLMATGIFDEGVDIPAIRSLVLAAGGKSEGRLLQRMGRGLRKAAGKGGLKVVDFYDLSKPLLQHSVGRKQLWEAEGYKVEVINGTVR